MCRLTVYKGRKILLGDIIVRPENSLIHQSRDAGYHPGVVDATGKRNIRVNGDGFGVAWYVYDLPEEPRPEDGRLQRTGPEDCPKMIAEMAAAVEELARPQAEDNNGDNGSVVSTLALDTDQDRKKNDDSISKNKRRDACCFKFITPAWSNQNLRNIGNYVQSSLIFAHIRAASAGIDASEDAEVVVNQENCHPFRYRQWTFMHNGGIPDFSRVSQTSSI